MRNIIVTGANGGIGVATIKEISSSDKRLICVDKNVDRIQKIINELPGKIEIVESDLGSVDECNSIIKSAGKISGLVHLAGSLESDLELNRDQELWARIMQSNLKNAYDLVGAIMKNLDESNYINFVFTTSLSYRRGSYESVAYSIAKAGIVGLTRSIAKRIGQRGSVNAIAPGIIVTDMSREYLSRHKERLIAQIPQKRFGEPEEVGKLIKFLISRECSYITGQVINIDGGSWNS